MTETRYTYRRLQDMLGLPIAWEVKGFKVTGGTLGVQAVCDTYPERACDCGQTRWHRNGTLCSIYQAPPVAGRDTLVKVTRTDWRCGNCRKRATSGPDWPSGSLIPSFEGQLFVHALEHPVSDTMQLYGVKRNVVERVLSEQGPKLLAERTVEAPIYLGLDGTAWQKKERAVFVDIPRRRHLEILEGHSGPAVTAYLNAQGREWNVTLKGAVIDLSMPFRQALRRYDPRLPVLVDRYHVSQRINRGVKRFADAYRQEHDTGCYRFLRNLENDDYTERMSTLVSKHPMLVEAHRYATEVRRIYETESKAEALFAWNAWLHELPSFLSPYLGGTLKNMDSHWAEEICSVVDHRNEDGGIVSNATTEAMHRAVRRWEALSSNMSFANLRMRLLLASNGEERNRNEAARMAALAECRRELQAASPFPN